MINKCVNICIHITDRRVAGKSNSAYTSNQQDVGIICGHVDEQSSSRGPKPSTYQPLVKVIWLVIKSYFHHISIGPLRDFIYH